MTGQVLTTPLIGTTTAAPAAVWARRAAAIVCAVALLTISAKIRVAVVPVPITMQTMVVVALGLALGARLGAAGVLAYLALGAAGAPVFAGAPEQGAGLIYMAGPTGGYLLGFLAATALTGALAERGWDRSLGWSAAAMALGLGALYTPGVLWLAYGVPLFEAGFGGLGLERALAVGVLPFLWIDAAKLALVAIGFPLIWRIARRG